jgi:hypothetical protein
VRTRQESAQFSLSSRQPGEAFVRFEYPISLILATIRHESRIFQTSSLADRLLLGVWFSFLALLLGPWGVPWGIYWTARAVWVNLSGGAEVTGEELEKAFQSCRP